jgi:precorrin-2 methylase
MERIVNALVRNESFRKSLIQTYKEVTEDGKLNEKDVPVLVKFISLNYNNIRNLRIQRDQIKDVFIAVIKTIIIEENLSTEEELDNILPFLDTALDLLVIQIRTSSCLRNVLSKLACRRN